MRSIYPISKTDQIIEDLAADQYQFSNLTIDTLSKQLRGTKETDSLIKLSLLFSNKAEGVLALRKTKESINVILTAHNAETGITFTHDPKHFPHTPDFSQLVNYLSERAILLQRTNKEGVIGDYFIQAIPEHYDRQKIKHLKLHPQQTYLMISNNYLNVQPGSDKFRIGGRSISESEFADLKKGNTVTMHNPWFYVPKQNHPGKIEKINLYGQYVYQIDLLKKSYKKIEGIKPAIEPEFLARNITQFVEHIGKMIGEKEFENKLLLGMENAYAAKKGDWNYLLNHLLFSANSSYVKNGNNPKEFIYPYQQRGYSITTSLTDKTIHLHPQGLSHDSMVAIELTDPVKILDSLLKSQQISETVYDLSIEQLSNNKSQGIKI